MKAQICPKCNGSKIDYEALNSGTDLTTIECGVCRGKGIVFVPETQEEFIMIMNYIPSYTVYSSTTETMRDFDGNSNDTSATSTDFNSENITLT
jgi:transcription elongation factor Elf1